MLTLLIVIIVIALLFDLVNGFHDAANSIATVKMCEAFSELKNEVILITRNVKNNNKDIFIKM